MQYPSPEHQTQVLSTLAEHGKLNTLQISKRGSLDYPVVLRTLAHLSKRHLVWLSEIGNRGPKSPKFYQLTAYGFIELFLRLDENNYKNKFKKEYEACPRYLTHLDVFRRESVIPELKITSHTLLTTFEEACKAAAPEEFSNAALAYISTRTTIDSNFFIYFYVALYPLKLEKLNILNEIFKKDLEFLDSWDTNFLPFISGLYEDILTLDKKIHVTLPRYDQTQSKTIFDKYLKK
jgi:hypothetical protein